LIILISTGSTGSLYLFNGIMVVQETWYVMQEKLIIIVTPKKPEHWQ